MIEHVRRPGIVAKPFTLPNTSNFAIIITTKHLHVAHDKYLNEVMGGLTLEYLETGPEKPG